MPRISILIAALLCPLSVQADLGTSIGVGVQYGGIIGIQGTYKFNATKFRLAFGAIGAGASVEQKLTPRVTAGFQVFASGIVIGQGIFLNYHFSGFNKKGFTIGIDYLFNSEVPLNRRRGNNLFLASVGYKY